MDSFSSERSLGGEIEKEMDRKKVGLLVTGMIVVVAAMIAIITPISADSSHYLMHTGQELQFGLAIGDTAEVSYYPHEVGHKQLKMWHTSWLYYMEHAWYSLYWTNNGGVNWHHSTDGSILFLWPTYEDLYSGQSNIGLKIVCENTDADVLVIHMKAT